MSNFFIIFSKYYIILTLISFVVVIIDLYKRPQKMSIMNVVWAITILWGGVITLLLYYKIGREKSNHMSMDMPDMNMEMMPDMNMSQNSICKSTTLSALHCGAGCTLADIIGEFSTISLTIPIYLQWYLDYILALIFGFGFQYIAIVQMQKMSFKNAILKAIKADFFSLTSWQIGMYIFMGFALFCIFKDIEISKTTAQFWFLMQIAMAVGFVFALPVNMILIKLKIKSGM